MTSTWNRESQTYLQTFMSSAAVPLHTGDARSGVSTAGDPLSLFLSFRLSRFRSDLSFDVFEGFSFTAGCSGVTLTVTLLSGAVCSSAGLGSHTVATTGWPASSWVTGVSSSSFTGSLTSLLQSFTGVFDAVEGRLRFRFPFWASITHTAINASELPSSNNSKIHPAKISVTAL